MAKIILGGSGSIAAYKMCDLARAFVKAGHDVFPVLTENASKLVSPLALSEICRHSTRIGMFDSDKTEMDHIELRDNADLMLIAPATANILGKCANGIADDLLSTTYLSINCPIVMAPAMNPSMWNHVSVQRNVKQLKIDGVLFCGPDNGDVLCGDSGEGKMSAIEDIFLYVQRIIS